MRISRADPEDPTGKRRRHFEISIDSPFTVLDCRATQANTALPQYCGRDRPNGGQQLHTTCGCPDAQSISRNASPSSSTGTLATNVSPENLGLNDPRSSLNRVNSSALPSAPQAAHLQPGATMSSASALQRVRNQEGVGGQPQSHTIQHRPMELLRYPSYDPPSFDADEPPPPMPPGLVTPPPNYDVIVGTPSVDGLADYFARLADYEDPDHASDVHPAVLGHANVLGMGNPADSIVLQESPSSDGAETETEGGDYLSHGMGAAAAADAEDEDSDSDSGDEHPARIHRGGRVNVANPRTPGGRRFPSRSLDLERPAVHLSLAGVMRRGERNS